MNGLASNIRIRGRLVSGEEKILTPEALRFVAELQTEFGDLRAKNLEWRQVVQKRLDAGDLSDLSFGNTLRYNFIRDSEWKVAPAPKDLECREVEITGPADQRNMVVNAAKSGADCYMADAEDSCSPNWGAIIRGQINLYDLIRRQIDFTDETSGKEYKLGEKTAVLFFRPRGWHLLEKHVLVNGKPMSASLFDFGMYFYHNAQALVDKSTGVYLYLPKMESYVEAMLWDAIFRWSEDQFNLPRGTIRATVLIETLPAAFQMDEILWALREHSAGLNCGRWDYIFSYIKKLAELGNYVLPQRSQLTMDQGFLAAYVKLLIQTCHKRGAYAMGGMAAQIPNKNDPEATAKAFAKVEEDKEREAKAGHDGTWVAHPGLVPIARSAFRRHTTGPNQLHVMREDVQVTAEDLLRVPNGVISAEGVYTNVRVGIQYLEAWLRGSGCVPLNNLMEDAATAEISRAQIWQWLKHRAEMYSQKHGSHPRFTGKVLDQVIREVMKDLKGGKFQLAERIFRKMVFAKEFPEFLTLEAYDHIVSLCGEK